MAVLSTSMNHSLGPAVCRVCLCSETSIPYLGNAPGEPLISPCHCKGTMGLYHRSCLEHWLSISRTYSCEICNFRFEIGRRKRGFLSYLRAHSWFIDAEHARSVGSDCACLLILTPLTIGGSMLCIKNISERLRHVDENGDFEKAHEILGLGLMAFFLIAVFLFWILFTVLFYVHDFHVWQKKNMIHYVIDQLDRDDEAYSRAPSHLSESQRPLLLRKKIRKFLCCGGQAVEDTIIPLRDTVVNVNPQMVEPRSSDNRGAGSSQQVRVYSPVTRSSPHPLSSGGTVSVITSVTPTSQELGANSAISSDSSSTNQVSQHIPSLSSFRPCATSSSAHLFPSTSTSPLFPSISATQRPQSDRIAIPVLNDEPAYSVPADAGRRQPVGLLGIVVAASKETGLQFETSL